MKLFISPHNDDAALFGAFTLQREKPVVLTVTDSWIQLNRGDGITFSQRREEDIAAMKILGCPLIFGGIRDDIVDEWMVRRLLSNYKNFEMIYAPAPMEGGNEHHNLIGRVAKEMFGDLCKHYTTYTKYDLYPVGTEEVFPTPEELTKKSTAMSCYLSQLKLEATAPHFIAVEGKSEWFI